MTYLTAKKIYPGNWNNALNGWYKNIDANPVDGTNEASKGGPTSVLALPGYRYFQQRGYVPITWASASATTSGQFMQVIVPSPYRQDDTRTDITGMVISGSAAQPSYVYRTAISVASGWDGRAASGVYAASGNIISFGRNIGTTSAVTGVSFSGVTSNVPEATIQANIAASQASSAGAAGIFFSGGTQGFGTNPFITTTGLPSITGVGSGTVAYYPVTSSTTLGVLAKGIDTGTSVSGGLFISDADVAAGRVGYLCVEVCYIRPDDAPTYEDIDSYLNNRTVS
jgi:hypothetical protein